MKVKFNLDDMTGIEHLTSGKEYESCDGGESIIDDIGRVTEIVTTKYPFNCSHLDDRAKWEIVK